MTSRVEGHDGPGSDLVDVLERWEASGGHWRVLDAREDRVDIALTSCDGELMSRVSGASTTVLLSFLAGRSSSAE